MRTSTLKLLAIIIASSLTIGGCQPKNEVRATKISDTQSLAQAKPDDTITPDGWVVVNEQTFIPIVDRLGEKLSVARQAYLKGDNNAAAIAMREGSAFLTQEMPNTSKEAQGNLKKASDELMEKASIVQMGEIDSVEDLDRIFVKAYQADVQHRWLFVDESEWIPVVEMPQEHFMTAKQDFVNKDYAVAVTEIRKGAEFLKLESNRTRDSDIKSNMLGAAHDLEQLAEEIKQGKVSDLDELDRGFARAQLAMGEFLTSKAQESESRGQLDVAGREIVSAFERVKAANTWLGRDNNSLQQTQIKVDALKDSLGSSNEAISRNLDRTAIALSEQITNLDRNLVSLK